MTEEMGLVYDEEAPLIQTENVDQPLMLEWILALESEEYAQGRFKLARETPQGTEYCCLGVGCEVAMRHHPDIVRNLIPLAENSYRKNTIVTAAPVYTYTWIDAQYSSDTQMPDDIAKGVYGLGTSEVPVRLPCGECVEYVAELNDDDAWNFKEIAAALRHTYLGEPYPEWFDRWCDDCIHPNDPPEDSYPM